MITIAELREVLEERLKTLDEGIESLSPSESSFDEACGRYEECKVILDLVKYVSDVKLPVWGGHLPR